MLSGRDPGGRARRCPPEGHGGTSSVPPQALRARHGPARPEPRSGKEPGRVTLRTELLLTRSPEHSGHKSPKNLGVPSERCPATAARRRNDGELGPLEAAQPGAAGPSPKRRGLPEVRPPAAPGEAHGAALTDRTPERGRCAGHRESRAKPAAPGPGKSADGRRSVLGRQWGRRGHFLPVPQTGAMPEPLPLLP